MNIKLPTPQANTHLPSVMHTDVFSQMPFIHSFIQDRFLLVAYSVVGPTWGGIACALTHSYFLTHVSLPACYLSTTTPKIATQQAHTLAL